MLEAAGSALVALADPFRLMMLFVGIVAGGIIGMLPGLGGVAAVSILLPFVYKLEPLSGLAMLLGALGVVYTADTITSVLVGTPGSPASGPTAIEGFAMARDGEAGRALGGSFLASMLGGLIGVVILTLAIPIAGPLVLAFGTPELLMLAIVGLAYASGLVGKSPVKGILAGAFGLFLGTVGAAPAEAELRYTFGNPYLLDGFALAIVALGFFGIAEVVSMLGEGGAIAKTRYKITGWIDGVRDVAKNWTAIATGSVIGVVTGLIPAIGANASTWIAYGQAISSLKDKSKVGKGEPRGMLAAEGANNATVTTDLVPTMLFGVPGGPAAAIFLGALYIYGFYPGPRFVQTHSDIMFLIIWSMALAAILGAALSFLVSPWIARITRLEFGLIAAPLVVIMFIGAFESKKSLLDFNTLIAFGILGWLMKRAGWPRAPLLVGFVLAVPIERNFWLTYQLHGWSWLYRPIVLLLAAIIFAQLAYNAWRDFQSKAMAAAPEDAAPRRVEHYPPVTAGRYDLGFALSAAAFAMFAAAIAMSFSFRFDSRLVPLLAAVPGLLCAGLLVVQHLRDRIEPVAWPPPGELMQIGILIAAVAAVSYVGFFGAIAGYVLVVLATRTSLRLMLAPYAAAIVFSAWGLSKLLNIPLP
jgi:putative tricarboxylic transport membrane protein